MNIKPGEKFDITKLKNPPLECEVSYGWLWNEPITKEGIDEQLESFLKAGIKSVYPIPLPKSFRPNTLRTFMSPEYLSNDFFEIMKYFVHRANELGMIPWIYDEGGWPSGSASGITELQNPTARNLTLGKACVELKKGDAYQKCEGFIGLFRGKERLPDNYVAQNDEELTVYFAEPNIIAKQFIDSTDESVTQTFIENTYEGYKNTVGDLFGEKMPLFFTDEPGLRRGILPRPLFKLFRERYGYDLEDYVYVLEGDGYLAETEAERQARIGYGEIVGELFLENTFKKISKWCEENGVYYAGHVMAENMPNAARCGYRSIMEVLRTMQIPGIDAIWEQIRMPYGGREPTDEEETRKMPFFPRVASSAARQMGRNLSLTETYSIYGDGITPDEMRYVSNYQAIRGINVFNFLNLPYGRSRCSALIMRPSFCPEKPGFENLAEIHGYYARLSYLLRLGYPEGDTALYHPTIDYLAGKTVCDEAIETYRALGVALEDKNIPFDIIDNAGIRDAKDTGDGLKLGDAIYRHIAVPKNRYMPDDVRKKIESYLSEPKAEFNFKNKKLRSYTRNLGCERLLFVFNEGIECANETISLKEKKNIYEIDLTQGNMYLRQNITINITSGDMCVFLLTDNEYENSPETVEYSVTVDNFKATCYKKFIVGYDGIYNEYGDGEPLLTKDFSGEVTYIAEYALPNKPLGDEIYRIRLEDFAVSANVTIGNLKIPFATTPMHYNISGDNLSTCGSFTVTVANTAANEIVFKNDVIESHPEAEVGVYHLTRLKPFELSRPDIKLGKIIIEKLK